MTTTPTSGAAYAALPDERAAFEAQFPVPGGVHWDGTEYVVKDSHVTSYRCNRFEGQWEAWKARASHGQAPAEPTAAGCLQHLTTLQEQAGMYADDFTPQAAQQAPAGVTLRSMIEGMSVSVDVSTGDHDAGHRYFGTVTEVMECQGDKHGVTLLVQDAEPNFTATPTAPSTPSSAAADTVVLEAALRAIHQAIDLIGEPDTERLRR